MTVPSDVLATHAGDTTVQGLVEAGREKTVLAAQASMYAVGRAADGVESTIDFVLPGCNASLSDALPGST